MIDKAKGIVETIKEAFDVLAAMELPAEEQKIEISRDAAMTLIAQLEQVARERDAAVEALRDTACCADCKNYETPMYLEPCKTCLMCPSQSKPNWQWRGVEVE